MDALLTIWNSILGATSTVGAAAGGVLASNTKTMDMAQLIALAAALGWASGIRLYLHVLQHPAMLAGSGFMLFVEFFADKIPGVDSLWDMVHSFIRVPAGAALAAGVFGADSATMGSVAGLFGGALAATSFATKASARAAVNTSPEPFSNIAVSLAEEGAVMGMMWLATNHPIAFGATLFVVLVLSVWVVFVLFKYLKAIYRRINGWVSGDGASASAAASA
jgi:Domain of unknown function (DUF4126)